MTRSPRQNLLLALFLTVAIAAPFIICGIRLPGRTEENQLEQHLTLYATGQHANASILAAASATAALTTWCADNKLAEPARITAQHVTGPENPITTEQRTLLKIEPTEPVRYRHVRLLCGTHLLSQAENWYVPGRLTPEMRERLEQDPTAPFGQVVAPLKPYRHTTTATWKWRVVPDRWETMPTAHLRDYTDQHADEIRPDPERELFQIDAVLHRDADGAPFSLVAERYKWSMVGFRLR